MKQLTGLDAAFLYMETPTTYGHINAVALYRPPGDPDYSPYEAFKAQVESRLHLLEPFRRRLVEVPLGLDHPYWINDPNFDIEFHVRHIAIPPPGDRGQLATQVARIIGRPMDRSRPLWEAYVMEGLEGDDFAVLTKTHHATIDGAAGVQLLMMLHDLAPGGDEVPPDDGSWEPEPLPTDFELLGRTFSSYLQRPYRLARFQLHAAQQLAEASRNQGLQALVSRVRQQMPTPWNGAGNDRELGALPTVRAPRTPLNGSISPHRRMAMRSVSLEDIKTIKTAAGVTVNDIVMAVSTGALRRYLQARDCLPDQPLRAMVPVSTRTGDEVDIWTNRVSALFVSLPTGEDDPLERIRVMSEAMVEAKEQFDLVPADAIVDLAGLSSPALAAQAARLASSLHLADQTTFPVNVVISNIPGPRESLYLAGSELQHYFPVSTISEGIGLNITVHSYRDHLDIGLVADRQLVPDLDVLVDLHVDEVGVLSRALGLPKKGPAKRKKSAVARKASAGKASAGKKSAGNASAGEKSAVARKASAAKKSAGNASAGEKSAKAKLS